MGRGHADRYALDSVGRKPGIRPQIDVQLAIDVRCGTVALDSDSLHANCFIGHYRNAPQAVPAEKRVIDWIEQDRLGRDRTVFVVTIQRLPNRPDISILEAAHEKGHITTPRGACGPIYSRSAMDSNATSPRTNARDGMESATSHSPG